MDLSMMMIRNLKAYKNENAKAWQDILGGTDFTNCRRRASI